MGGNAVKYKACGLGIQLDSHRTLQILTGLKPLPHFPFLPITLFCEGQQGLRGRSRAGSLQSILFQVLRTDRDNRGRPLG